MRSSLVLLSSSAALVCLAVLPLGLAAEPASADVVRLKHRREREVPAAARAQRRAHAGGRGPAARHRPHARLGGAGGGRPRPHPGGVGVEGTGRLHRQGPPHRARASGERRAGDLRRHRARGGRHDLPAPQRRDPARSRPRRSSSAARRTSTRARSGARAAASSSWRPSSPSRIRRRRSTAATGASAWRVGEYAEWAGALQQAARGLPPRRRRSGVPEPRLGRERAPRASRRCSRTRPRSARCAT